MTRGDYEQLAELARTRARLYKLSVVFYGSVISLFIFLANTLPAVAVEPHWKWLAALVNSFIPASHDGLAGVIATYPRQALLLVLAASCLVWVGRRVKTGSREFAFQAWQRTGVAGKKKLNSAVPPPGADLKLINRLAPPQWLTCSAVIGILLVLTL